jgi:hypothetical protein
MAEHNKEDSHIESVMYDQLKDSFDTVLLRLDPGQTLTIIKYSLMRYTYNTEYKRWENPHKLPAMLSADGIYDLMIELDSRMSVDKVLGNLTDKEYNIILRELGESVLQFLYFNFYRYKIREGDFERIYYIIYHNVRIFLSRARNGWENILLSKQMQYREEKVRRGDVTYDSGDEKRKSWGFGGKK